MTIEEMLNNAVKADASDIFLIAGLPLTYKCNGSLDRVGEKMLLPDDIDVLIKEIYTVSQREAVNLDKRIDDDFSFAISGLGRFRVNIFRQRGTLAAVIRVIKFGIPDPEKKIVAFSGISQGSKRLSNLPGKHFFEDSHIVLIFLFVQ